MIPFDRINPGQVPGGPGAVPEVEGEVGGRVHRAQAPQAPLGQAPLGTLGSKFGTEDPEENIKYIWSCDEGSFQ